MVQVIRSLSSRRGLRIGRAPRTLAASMVQFLLFLAIGGLPIFLFLRKWRTLRLSRGYALILTVPIVVGLWVIAQVMVGLGRM